MRDSKRAILSVCAVVLAAILLSLLIIYPVAPVTKNQDAWLRDSLAGELDYLIAGASQAQCALYTPEIDGVLQCSSYNLSYDALGNYEKKVLLEKEMSRNPVKTVVLELSYDLPFSTRKTDYTDANIHFINRIDTFSERLAYYASYVNTENKWFVYSDAIWGSLHTLLFGASDKVDDEAAQLKGSRLLPGRDYRLQQDEIAAALDSEPMDTQAFCAETVDAFAELIALCKAHGAEVVVAVVPVSEQYLWRKANLDAFDDWARAFCEENGVAYYDFNLLIERDTLLSDEDCYSTDTHHMSETGAKRFSKRFAEILQAANQGEDVSPLFYPSFKEAKTHSPYYGKG